MNIPKKMLCPECKCKLITGFTKKESTDPEEWKPEVHKAGCKVAAKKIKAARELEKRQVEVVEKWYEQASKGGSTVPPGVKEKHEKDLNNARRQRPPIRFVGDKLLP